MLHAHSILYTALTRVTRNDALLINDMAIADHAPNEPARGQEQEPNEWTDIEEVD